MIGGMEAIFSFEEAASVVLYLIDVVWPQIFFYFTVLEVASSTVL